MKTLEQWVQEVKESMVHKCNKSCRPPIHTGGGNYNSLSDIPESMNEAIREEAQARMQREPKEPKK